MIKSAPLIHIRRGRREALSTDFSIHRLIAAPVLRFLGVKRRELVDPELSRLVGDRLRSVLADQVPRRASMPAAAIADAPEGRVRGFLHDLSSAGLTSGWSRCWSWWDCCAPDGRCSARGRSRWPAREVRRRARLSRARQRLPRADPSSASPAAVRIVVHVLGAVRRPGLVSLPDGSRVQDAIEKAGGLKRSADPGDLNLAQLLTDGEQIVIGTEGEPAGEVRDGGGGGGGGSTGGPGSSATLDLNRATRPSWRSCPVSGR